MVCIGAVVAACQTRCSRAVDISTDGDGYDEVRLLRRSGETKRQSADYDAELDSDSDAVVDFIRPTTAGNTLAPAANDVIQ